MGIFSNLFASQDVVFRFSAIILIALYGLFALIVAVQISNLNKLLMQQSTGALLTIFSLINLFVSIALLFVAVLSL